VTSGQDFDEIGFEVQSSGGMGMRKHTAGPWRVVESTNPSQFAKGWREIRGQQKPVVYADEYQSSRDGTVCGVRISEDNARLIAAAPDLLAACEKFAAAMRSGEKPDFLKLVEALHEADSAIAKATGATP
jgi:hypothetical protein